MTLKIHLMIIIINLNKFGKFSVTPERCRLRCPGECVMSEWSNWTECPNSCQALSKFTKTRWKFATGQSFNGFSDCSNETVTETVDCMAKRKWFHFSFDFVLKNLFFYTENIHECYLKYF